MYTFNICDNSIKDVFNIQHIHPRKQRQVAELSRKMKPYADSIIVCGSSIRWDCGPKSDLDITFTSECNIKWPRELKMLISDITHNNYDVIEVDETDDYISEQEKNNFIRKGVRIYAEGVQPN